MNSWAGSAAWSSSGAGGGSPSSGSGSRGRPPTGCARWRWRRDGCSGRGNRGRGRARRRGLGVHHPVAAAQGLEIRQEGGPFGQRGEGAAEAQAALVEGAEEAGQEERAEAAGEHPDGQEEARPAGEPAVAGRGGAAAGDDAVQVAVVAQAGAPRVEHGEPAGHGAEMVGVGGDLAQGARGRAEQQAVQQPAILQGDRRDRGGEGEHDMEVGGVVSWECSFCGIEWNALRWAAAPSFRNGSLGRAGEFRGVALANGPGDRGENALSIFQRAHPARAMAATLSARTSKLVKNVFV